MIRSTLRARRRGITLVETLCYLLLVVLIVTGATMALIATLRGSTRISGRSAQVRESARMVRRLSTDLNEASFAILPTDATTKRTWPILAGSSRLYIASSGGSSLNTGVITTIPGRYDLILRNSAGNAVAFNGSDAPLRRTVTEKGILIYRGKTNGDPDSQSGTNLWMKTLSSARQFSTPILVSKQISRVDDAVSFQINKDGLIVARVSLQDAALADNEANPISFTIELGNYTSEAATQARTFLGGS